MKQKEISFYYSYRWMCIVYHYSNAAMPIGNVGAILAFVGIVSLLFTVSDARSILNQRVIPFILVGGIGLLMLYIAYKLNKRAKLRYDEEHGTLKEQFKMIEQRNLMNQLSKNSSRRTHPDVKLCWRKAERMFRKFGAEQITLRSGRCWMLNGVYFRLDVIKFPSKPFLVIEWTDELEEAENHVFGELNSFPYDLDDEELAREVKHVLYEFL